MSSSLAAQVAEYYSRLDPAVLNSILATVNQVELVDYLNFSLRSADGEDCNRLLTFIEDGCQGTSLASRKQFRSLIISSPIIGFFSERLKLGNWHMRRRAVQSLRKVGATDQLQFLERVLLDCDKKDPLIFPVLLDAVVTLGLGFEKQSNMLQAFLASTSRYSRWGAIDAIEAFGLESSFKVTLKEIASGDSESILRQVANAILDQDLSTYYSINFGAFENVVARFLNDTRRNDYDFSLLDKIYEDFKTKTS